MRSKTGLDTCVEISITKYFLISLLSFSFRVSEVTVDVAVSYSQINSLDTEFQMFGKIFIADSTIKDICNNFLP